MRIVINKAVMAITIHGVALGFESAGCEETETKIGTNGSYVGGVRTAVLGRSSFFIVVHRVFLLPFVGPGYSQWATPKLWYGAAPALFVEVVPHGHFAKTYDARTKSTMGSRGRTVVVTVIVVIVVVIVPMSW